MSVLPSNTGTAVYNSTIATTQNFTFTVNSGDTLAVFFIVQDASQTITSVTWDKGGTNQACTLVGSKSSTASSIYVYAVVSPTVGAKTLAVVNAVGVATSAEMQSFTGTVSSSVSAACTNALTASGITSAGGNYGTAAQSGSPGNMLVGAFIVENNLVAVSNTPIYTLFPTSAKDAAANYYEVTTGSSISLTANIYTSGVSWAAVSFNVVNASPTISNLTASSLTPGGASLGTPAPLGTYSMTNVFASPSTINPGATLSISGTITSNSNVSVVVQYLIREVVNFVSNTITSVNSATLTLVANTPQAVNLSVLIPSTTAYDTYLIDAFVFTTDFVTTLLYVNTATTFTVQAVGTSVTFPFKLGVYKAAQNPTVIAAYENWLGHPVDLINDTIPSDSWDNMINGGWAYFASQWVNDVSRMVVTIPMIPTFGDYGGTNMTDAAVSAALASGASGAYDSNWITMRQDLIDGGFGNNIIRLGWEMNGNWYNWRAFPNPTAWVTYWQRIVTILRNDPAAHFIFNFNPTAGQQVILADSVYPGDAYVDAIGLDIYDQDYRGYYPIPTSDTPAQVLAAQQNVWTTDILGQFNYGLTFWSNFATTHGKPFMICEWGVYTPANNGGGDDTYYIQSMHDYAMNPANGVTALIYFDLQGLQALYNTPSQPTQFPNSSALYLQLFGSSLSPPVVLGDYALDYGMQSFHNNCDRLYICTGPITDFNSVISSSIGFKNFGVGNAFGGINNGSPSGRTVTSIAFGDGTVTANGVAAVWAAVDFANSHLLAWGALFNGVSVTTGQVFGLPAFIIHEPAYFSGASIAVQFSANALASQAAFIGQAVIIRQILAANSLVAAAAGIGKPNIAIRYNLTAFSFQPNHADALGTPVLTVLGTLGTRNVFQQPFGVNSIWNTPIGVGTGGLHASGTGPHGGAQYSYANGNGPIYEFCGTYLASNSSQNTLANENLILLGPASPLKQVMSNTSGWSVNPSAPARCAAVQTPTGWFVPVPANASYPGLNGTDICNVAGVNGQLPNCPASILLADRQSTFQMNPMQICSVGGSPTAQYWQPAWGTYVSIFSDETSSPPSAWGSHGSFMNAYGGTIRVNELIPGNCPIVPGVADVMRHALAWEFNSNSFPGWGAGPFWPAINADTGQEGLLLALLPTFNISSLTTPAAQSIAWTAMNYGIYCSDDSGWNAVNIDFEYSYGDSSVNCPTGRSGCQFQTVWGFPIGGANNSSSFGADIISIMSNMYVITNNTVTSIGGPGVTRMQPLAAAPYDPGVITVVPAITNVGFSISHTVAAGTLVGTVHSTNSPYNWSLSGTGASNFWIQPTTGIIYTAAVSGGNTALATAIFQNTVGNSVGRPLGVPTSYSWYNGKDVENATPPSNFTSCTGWGQIYPMVGEPVSTTASIQVANFTTYILLTNGSWSLVQQQSASNQITGAYFTASYVGNANIAWTAAPQADGSIIISPVPSGYVANFWTNNRGNYAAGTAAGLFTFFDAKIVNDSSAFLIANQGADWWLNASAPFLSDYSNNPGVGQSDWVQLTPSYQRMYETSLSAAALTANPPPGLTGSGGLTAGTYTLTVTATNIAGSHTGTVTITVT